MIALWLPDLRQCGYLPRDSGSHSPAVVHSTPSAGTSTTTAASFPLTAASSTPSKVPAFSTPSAASSTPAHVTGILETPDVSRPGNRRRASTGGVAEAAAEQSPLVHSNKLWVKFRLDVESDAVDPGVVGVLQLIQAHKKEWSVKQFKKRAAELGKAKDPYRTKTMYDVGTQVDDDVTEPVNFSRFAFLFQQFCLSKNDSDRRYLSS